MSYDDPFENMAPDSDGDFFDDDFQELVRDKTEAKGQGDLSDIAAEARVRQIRDERQLREAPFVRINPRSSGRGTLGNSAIVQPNQDPTEVAFWYADDDTETTVMTVTVAPEQMVAGTFLNTSQSAGLIADVRWGQRAAPALARVDVGKGCQFTIAGSFVSVSVGTLQTATMTPQMRVSAWIGFFATNRTAPVTRTLYIDDLASLATSSAFIIPAFARQLLPIQRSPLSNAMTLIFRNNAGATIARLYGGDTDYSVMSGPMPMPFDAYSFTVTNDGASSLAIRFPFELAL